MTAQKKTIIKRAFLRVMGDARGEGVDVTVIIKHRDGHRIPMRGLPGKGFLHLEAGDLQLGLVDQPRQHRGIDGVNVQDGVSLREQAIDEGMQPGLCRRFTARRRTVGGDFNL